MISTHFLHVNDITVYECTYEESTSAYFPLRVRHALHMYFKELYDLRNFYNLLLRFNLETGR